MRDLLPAARGRFFAAAACAAVLLLLGACSSDPPAAPVIAEAWAGPATLKVRRDIPLNAPIVDTAQHGDRLEILQQRRRFLRVRTPSGKEGWTESNLLLSSEEMSALRELSARAKKMQSHGTATTFDLLNVHTTPARQSPSFMQVKQGEKMEVLMHLVAPRSAPARAPLIPPAPKKPRLAKKKKAREAKYPPPPQPVPPSPPANWLELSKTNLPPEPPEPPKPVPTDDWTLVRMHGGQAGWVLTRRLFMAIPDEVAQYAEGHRITGYFPLGEVDDEGTKKYHWLWTTTGSGLAEHDFDSFRVFIWSLRRHRYETAYIERKLKGFFPVELHPVTLSSGGRAPVSTSYPGFSVCVEKEDGQRYRRSFAFIVNVVRFAGQGPCTAILRPPAASQQQQAPGTQVASAQPAPPPPDPPSFFTRVKMRIGDVARRWFKKGGGQKDAR